MLMFYCVSGSFILFTLRSFCISSQIDFSKDPKTKQSREHQFIFDQPGYIASLYDCKKCNHSHGQHFFPKKSAQPYLPHFLQDYIFVKVIPISDNFVKHWLILILRSWHNKKIAQGMGRSTNIFEQFVFKTLLLSVFQSGKRILFFVNLMLPSIICLHILDFFLDIFDFLSDLFWISSHIWFYFFLEIFWISS